MPLFFISAKVAVTMGAFAGATVAIINNREKMLEAAEFVLQKGADMCKQRLEEVKRNKMHFAAAHEDDWLAQENVASATGATVYNDTDFDDDELTTPDSSDFYASDYNENDDSDANVDVDEWESASIDDRISIQSLD